MAHPSFIVAVVLEQAGQGHKQENRHGEFNWEENNNNNLARGAFEGGRSEVKQHSQLHLLPLHLILFLSGPNTLHHLQTMKHQSAVISLAQKTELSLSRPPKDIQAHQLSMQLGSAAICGQWRVARLKAGGQYFHPEGREEHLCS